MSNDRMWSTRLIEGGTFIVHPAGGPDDQDSIMAAAAISSEVTTADDGIEMPVVLLGFHGQNVKMTGLSAELLAEFLTKACTIAHREIGDE